MHPEQATVDPKLGKSILKNRVVFLDDMAENGEAKLDYFRAQSDSMHRHDLVLSSGIWEAGYIQYLLEESKWLCEEVESGRVTFQQICRPL